MSRIEYLVLTLLFIAGCVYVDVSSRHMKALDGRCDRADVRAASLEDECETLYERMKNRVSEANKLDERLKALETKCSACSCPAKPDCCAKDCCCCKCEPKAQRLPTAAKLCRFTYIVIHDGWVSFGWVDTDGREHESVLAVEEIEGLNPED
jgi:hypothetical protein